MSKYQNNSLSIIFPIIVVGIVIVVGLMIDRAVCKSKWAKSGMYSDWGPIQGCLIRLPPDKNGVQKWIPEERYREFDN